MAKTISISLVLLVAFFVCVKCLSVAEKPLSKAALITLCITFLAIVMYIAKVAPSSNGSSGKRTRKNSTVGEEENASDKAYALGRFNSHFIRTPEELMGWLEDQVGEIYSFGGKIPNLRDPLLEVRRLVAPFEQQGASTREPLDDLHHCRNLVAQDYDPQKAFKLTQQYLEYRIEMGGGGVRPPIEWIHNSFVYVPFEDRLGRPVVIVRAKYVDPSMPMELITAGFRSTVDGIIGHLLHKRSSRPDELNPLEQYIVLLDVEGSGFNNFSPELVKMMVREGAIHYPDRLCRLYVLGATFVACQMFNIASPLLHPRTRNKVKLFRTGESGDFLQDLIGRDTIPPPVSPHEAENLEESVGALLAASWRRYGIAPRIQNEPLHTRTSSFSDENKRSRMCCW